MEDIEKLREKIILWNNVKMEWASNNATGAENHSIRSRFVHTPSTDFASSCQKATVDTNPHRNLCSWVCTAGKTTHCFCRKEVSSLEQGRQKKPTQTTHNLNLSTYKTAYAKTL